MFNDIEGICCFGTISLVLRILSSQSTEILCNPHAEKKELNFLFLDTGSFKNLVINIYFYVLALAVLRFYRRHQSNPSRVPNPHNRRIVHWDLVMWIDVTWFNGRENLGYKSLWELNGFTIWRDGSRMRGIRPLCPFRALHWLWCLLPGSSRFHMVDLCKMREPEPSTYAMGIASLTMLWFEAAFSQKLVAGRNFSMSPGFVSNFSP